MKIETKYDVGDILLLVKKGYSISYEGGFLNVFL